MDDFYRFATNATHERRRVVLRALVENDNEARVSTLAKYIQATDEFPALTEPSVLVALLNVDQLVELDPSVDSIHEFDGDIGDVQARVVAENEVETLIVYDAAP